MGSEVLRSPGDMGRGQQTGSLFSDLRGMETEKDFKQ